MNCYKHGWRSAQARCPECEALIVRATSGETAHPKGNIIDHQLKLQCLKNQVTQLKREIEKLREIARRAKWFADDPSDWHRAGVQVLFEKGDIVL